MEDRSGLLAQNFLIPQQQMQQQAAPQPFNDGITPLDGLQDVKGQTADYYKKVAALKSFMQSANKNMGIDVRVPDASRPESIKLNQIFNDALSDILGQGNQLKTSNNLFKERDQRGVIYDPNYDPNSNPASQAQPGREFWERALPGSVTEANDVLGQQSWDQGQYKQKLQIYADEVKKYQDVADSDPSQAAAMKYKIDGLVQPTRAVKQFAKPRESSYNSRSRKQEDAAGNWVKKVTNLFSGAHDSYRPDQTDLNDGGKPKLVSNEFKGQLIGDRRVVKWVFDPDTDEVVLYSRDKDGNVSMDEVGGNDPQEIARDLSKLPTEAIIAAMERGDGKTSYYDEYQQVNRNMLLGPEYESLKDKNKLKSTELYNHSVNMAATTMTDKLKALKTRTSFFDNYERTTVGKFKIVRKAEDNWEIENIEEAIPIGNRTLKEAATYWKDKKSWPDLNELIKFLEKQGAHMADHKKQSGTKSATTSQPTTNTPLTEGAWN